MIVAGVGSARCACSTQAACLSIPREVRPLKALAGLAGSLFTLKDATRSGAIAEAALAREEKRRAIALDAASLASWAWDIRGDVIECDTLLPELFNLPRSNGCGARDILTAIDPRDVYRPKHAFAMP